MAATFTEARQRTLSVARHPRTRKIAIWFLSILIAIGVLLGLVAPPLLRSKVAGALSDKLQRKVTIEQISINPYAMTVAVRGFLMRERQSETPAFAFDELFINLEYRSLLRWAPVVKELLLIKPYVNVVRNEDLKYNFQDVIDQFTSGPPRPPGPPPRFALNNIQVVGGNLDFDDRPERTKHTVTDLRIGVPFISSLPSDVDIKVNPEFSAVVNGAPFHIAGDTVPFKDSHESAFSLNIDNLQVGKYLEYSPVKLNFTIPTGHLDGKIKAAFKAAKDHPAVLTIGGNLAVSQLEMHDSAGTPPLKLPTLEILIDSVDLLARKASVKAVKSTGLELDIRRGADGKLSVVNLVEPLQAQPEEPKATAKPGDRPFIYAIEEIALEGATIHFADEQPRLPYKTTLKDVRLNIAGLTNEADKKAELELGFESASQEKFAHTGTLQLNPLAAEGKLNIEGLRPGALRSYYADSIAAEIKEGFFDLATRYNFVSEGGKAQFKLSELAATLRSLRLELPGQPEPLWRLESLSVSDAALDLAAKSIVIGALEGKNGNGYIQRAADGTLNLVRIAKPQTSPPAPVPAATAKSADDAWKIDLKQLTLDRFRINVDDRGNATPAKISLSDLALRAENFSTAKNQRGKARLRARVNNKGIVRLAGTATLNPVNARFQVDAQELDVVVLQPYLEKQVNFALTGGRAATKGDLSFDAAGTGPAKINYKGAVQLTEFGAVENETRQDLLKWKSLSLDAVEFDAAPFQLRIGEITLAEFYSRLILGADGKLNLQKLAAAQEPTPAEPPVAEKPSEPPTAPAATDEAAPKAINIGKINLKDGNIQFSDFFIKPNYSANLVGVRGAISELKPEAPGDLDIQARLENAAPVDIKGKINPLGKELFLDLIADAKDIELSPMSPYSGKYVGYGIKSGKLSFNVKYRVENRSLTAQNKIILNQLTFGERVESPDAIKAPVLLAVALMKDRNGVIDVDLPISGSLDDPQFSVGGIILRVIVNLITRAVTAPFSLLASAFGGGSGGEELSYIEFDNGRSTLTQVAKSKITTLAKALSNRPALRLEIAGRTDPLTDIDGLKRANIEHKVKALKLKDLARKTGAAGSVEDVQVAPNEYPEYLKAAYRAEPFPKPRNMVGLVQDVPVPEMERLMMQHAQVGEEEMRQLAAQRAQNVRDAILAAGDIAGERISIVTANPLSVEERAKLKGRPNRVDFSMK